MPSLFQSAATKEDRCRPNRATGFCHEPRGMENPADALAEAGAVRSTETHQDEEDREYVVRHDRSAIEQRRIG
jgi:hypothetical protein